MAVDLALYVLYNTERQGKLGGRLNMIQQQQAGAPTVIQYTEFDKAFDYLNGALFSGELPKVLVTFSRKPRMLGYYSPERWERTNNPEDLAGEISFNPDSFEARTAEEVLSTLTHEMAHAWQHHFGSPSRAGYHNVEWGQKMDEIGLTPTNTGKPGGKRTGQQMTHFIVEDGPFALAAADLLALGWGIQYVDRSGHWKAAPGPDGKGPQVKGSPKGPATPKPPTRAKFVCPGCKAAAWGKPGLNLVCGNCQKPMA